MNVCQILALYLCIFLVAIMISKRFTPIYIHKKLHSSLYIILISTAADIVDFAEYSNDHEIVNHYGVDFIWGILFFFHFFCFQKIQSF